MPAKLSAKAHAAIWDDHSIVQGVRVAVLTQLESSHDPASVFNDLVDGETFKGRTVDSNDFLYAARTIPCDSFVKGLQLGWFGARLGEAAAHAVQAALESALLRGYGSDRLTRLLRSLVPSDAAHAIDRSQIAWYYFDNSATTSPLSAASEDLGLRLALPRFFEEWSRGISTIPCFVVQVELVDMDDPRRPRFPDAGRLEYLEFWRPGGKTAPWNGGLLGLDEVVDRPLAIGLVGGAYAFVNCKTS
jgi:hypothetical protein